MLLLAQKLSPYCSAQVKHHLFFSFLFLSQQQYWLTLDRNGECKNKATVISMDGQISNEPLSGASAPTL